MSTSVNKRIIFAVSTGWGSKAVSILVNLVQIPLLFRYLDDELLGVWFLMIGAQMVLGVFDFGLGQTLQRRIAFAKGECGADPDAELGENTRQKIRDLLQIARRTYHVLSALVLLVLLIGGPAYFRTLNLSPEASQVLKLAWIIMAVGYAANMWGWYVEATLNGMGDIGWSNIVTSVLWVAVLGATWLVLIMGGSIALLAVIWVLRGVILRLGGWMVVKKRHPWLSEKKGVWQSEEFYSMVKPALKWWLAILGTFLLTGTSRFFVGGFLGASAVPDFVATFTALSFVQVTIGSVIGVTTPLLSQMWRAGEIERMREYVLRLTRLGLVLMVMAYVLICVYGKEIFELWLGEGHFVGYPVLVVFTIMMFLEAHQGMHVVTCSASEKLGFFKPTLLAGILCLALSPILIPKYQLIGAVIAIFIPELLTIDWIVPRMSLKIIKFSAMKYFTATLLPIVSLGLFSGGLVFLYKKYIPGLVWASPIVLIMLTILISYLTIKYRYYWPYSIKRDGQV